VDAGRLPHGSTPGCRTARREADSLRARSLRARDALRECRLCPRECGADRTAGEAGFCGAGAEAKVAAASLHFGEEPPISGTRGSGTVFFSHCNMACLFCQNYPISQLGNGKEVTVDELAGKLLRLQERGAHNVNFVTPTPYVPHLVGAVAAAREKGFTISVVYNTNGYDSLEALGLLDGVVDIYLPDMKYRSADLADLASATPDYPVNNARAVAEMLRQTGPLTVGEDGIATRGVNIRHLVLPGRVDETEQVLTFIRETHGPDMPLSLMGQYFPAYKAMAFNKYMMKRDGDAGEAVPRFDRKLSTREYDRAIEFAVRLGLANVFIRDNPENLFKVG
jgi:putative pyruvate formate lyase activating enzyme